MSPLVLSDGWPDGPPEELVHVEVDAAPAGGAAAVRVALAELDGYVELMEEATIVATGRRAWFRQAPCAACEGTGAEDDWQRRGALTLSELDRLGELQEGPAPACESCRGTGEQDGDEGYRYQACDQLDEGATEFWVLEVVPA